MLRRWRLSVTLAGIALVALSSLGAANGVDTSIVLAATDDGCPEDREACFQVLEGDLAHIEGGHGVQIVLENQGDRAHTLHVTTLEQADPDARDTPENASFASTDRVEPGEQGQLAFQPPGFADGIYLWCDLPGHEGQGMWLEVPFGNASPDPGAGDASETPGPSALIAGVALAFVAACTRR